MPTPSADQLARIESLGLNCEVGNVLRRFGNETPSLFRWTWTPPQSILALLHADFAGLYEPMNMEPGHHDEVRDRTYDIWFHTNVRTGDPDGGADFRFLDSDETARNRILRAEKSVIEALVARFRKRMETPQTLFVLTRHAREPHGSAEEIAAAIRSRRASVPFALLEVLPGAEPSQVGQVMPAGENLYRGYVSRFAPYDAADDIDMDSWTVLLEAALAMTGSRSWWRGLGGGRARSNASV